MRKIVIEKLNKRPVEKEEIEIVERKGLGHPDSICDGLAEIASSKLSQYYLRKFKRIFHHNLDKGILIGGEAKPKFKGGKILKPIKITVVGRATDRVGKFKIAVDKIIKDSFKNYLFEKINIPKKEIDKIFKLDVNYRAGSVELKSILEREIPIANDTSFGVAHGPLSLTEKATLFLCKWLNSKRLSKRFPFIGKDIKVMTLRKKRNFYFTLAIAFIDKFIENVSDYFRKKELIKKEIERYLKKIFKFRNFKIEINTLDDLNSKDEEGIYLTVSGLSGEQGDDGQVGRGNRVCGLIIPNREMSLEAPAGKNINHPGKLYQILSYLIAQKIGNLKEIKECSVSILSQIGKPLDEPQIILVKIISDKFKKAKEKVQEIVNFYFDNLKKIQLEIVFGKYPLF